MKQDRTDNLRRKKVSLTAAHAIEQHNDAQLRRLLQRLLRARTDTSDITGAAALLRELRVHQIELEMRNRELRAARTALEASRERYAELYDNAPVGYITLNSKNEIREANLVAATQLGLAHGELLGKRFSTLLAREQRAGFFQYVKLILAHAAAKPLELRVCSADGTRHDLRIIGSTQQDTESGARACRIALFDLTEEKQQQESLRLHSLIMENMVEGVMLVRAADSIILETNPAFYRMFGYNADDLIGRHVAILNAGNGETPHEVAARITEVMRRLGKWEGEVHNVRKDGSAFWSQAAVTTFVHSAHGSVWVAVHRDITQRKRDEQQARERQEDLVQVSRLNTVGELAATLAHELTQPVMAIEHFNHAAIGLVESGNADREELLRLLRYEDQQVKRAGDVIRQLRKFVRRGVVDKKLFNLATAIDEALALLRPMLVDRGIEVRVTCDTAGTLVSADAVQIEQVLVNLLRNSVDALATVKQAPGCIDITFVPHPNKVEVVVRDNGPGLDPAHETMLFNVFESQKLDGMGMGLAISRSIILAHGGQLWAEPATAGGAAFHFTLPIDAHEARAT